MDGDSTSLFNDQLSLSGYQMISLKLTSSSFLDPKSQFLSESRSRIVDSSSKQKGILFPDHTLSVVYGQLLFTCDSRFEYSADVCVHGYSGITGCKVTYVSMNNISLNNIQPCPKRCLLLPLAHVGAKTDSTMRTATTQGMANFRARAWHSTQDMQYAPRVFTLVLSFETY